MRALSLHERHGYTISYRAARSRRKGESTKKHRARLDIGANGGRTRGEGEKRRGEEQEGGRGHRRVPANGSIKFMGALRWFQTLGWLAPEYKGCLAWESRVPTIISPFHRDRHVLPSSSTFSLSSSLSISLSLSLCSLLLSSLFLLLSLALSLFLFLLPSCFCTPY